MCLMRQANSVGSADLAAGLNLVGESLTLAFPHIVGESLTLAFPHIVGVLDWYWIYKHTRHAHCIGWRPLRTAQPCSALLACRPSYSCRVGQLIQSTTRHYTSARHTASRETIMPPIEAPPLHPCESGFTTPARPLRSNTSAVKVRHAGHKQRKPLYSDL